MKLINCHIENFKRHREVNIDFAEGITLIGGMNESGKSSIVDGMHKVLFLKYNSTGHIVESLRSKIYPGHPYIKMIFEAKGEKWTLGKRFSGQSGSVMIQGSNTPTYTGPAAEELLAKLLCVDEIVGSRQASRILPNRWAHLWVRQGLASENLFDRPQDAYELKDIIKELQKVSNSSFQSENDLQVKEKLDALVSETFTTKGTRKNSNLWEKEIALLKAKEYHEQIKSEVKGFEDIGEELEKIEKDLKEIEEEKLANIKITREKLLLNLEKINTNSNELKLIVEKSKLLKKQNLDLEEILIKFDKINKEIIEKEIAHKNSQERLVSLTTKIMTIKIENDTLKKITHRETHELTRLEEKGRYLRDLEEVSRTREEYTAIKKKLLDHKKKLDDLEILLLKKDKIPKIAQNKLELAKNYNKKAKQIEIRIDAMSSILTVTKTDKNIYINNSLMKQGEAKRLSSDIKIRVGEGVEINITPGEEVELEKLNIEYTDCKEKETAILNEVKLESIDEAEEASKQLSEVNQAIDIIKSGMDPKIETKEDLIRSEQDLISLKSRLIFLEGELEKDSTAKDYHYEINSEQNNQLNIELKDCRVKYKEASDSIKELKSHTERLANKSSKLREEMHLQEIRSKVLDSEIKEKKEQLTLIIKQHGKKEHINAIKEKVKSKYCEIKGKENDLISCLKNEDVNKTQEKIDSLYLEEQKLSRQIKELIEKRGSLSERSKAISNKDIYALLEEAKIIYKKREQEEKNQRVLSLAHKKLLNMMNQAQLDFSKKYTAPLSNAINYYMKPLLKEFHDGCRLEYSPEFGLSNLNLYRQGSEILFKDLSGGTKEQLNCAIRLSIADVLQRAHDGSLPLIFDDAFSNTDNIRIELILSMLTDASKRGLQIIILSCNPHLFNSIADKSINLDPNN